MNVFDIIVYLTLAWAIYNGWQRGFLLQIVSLLAVVAALYFSVQYGSELERILHIHAGIEGVTGFIIIFVVFLLVISIGGYALRAVFRLAGLGIADTLLGILFSVAKMALIISVFFSWFDSANKDNEWVSKQTIEESRCFKPIVGITDKLTPYFEELKEEIFD